MIAVIAIQNIISAALLMFGLGTVFAVVLLIASIKLKVEVDPKIEEVHAVLPKIDCGTCGYAGCAAYAQAVVADPAVIGRCSPGGPTVANKIAAVLNLQISGSGAPKRPIIHCHACEQHKTYFARYDGIIGCTSANAQPNVQACAFGCLGYGGCVRRCRFDALHMIDGLAVVDYAKCTGCGACVAGCPRNLIEMVPFTQDPMLVVACSNKENGKTTRAQCQVGCIACGLCKKQSDLFSINDNLARMDYTKYQPSEATETARLKCPTKVIVFRGKNAPAEEPAQAEAAAAQS
jgi:electron transport complex protein RnfB